MTTYLTGETIDSSNVSWTADSGVNVSLTLLRNAKSAINGWLRAGTHALVLTGNGREVAYYGKGKDGTLLANMGRIIIRVPAEHRAAVDALLAEHDTHNAATESMGEREDAEYAAHTARIERAMNP